MLIDPMISELQELAANGPNDTVDKTPLSENNTYLAKSALQKAIRRGLPGVALTMAKSLYPTIKTAVWPHLATIIVEDVGLGDIDLVAYSCVTTLASVRAKVPEEDLYLAMVERAAIGYKYGASGFKSRACCELSLGVDSLLEVTGGIPEQWLPWPKHISKLAEIMVSDHPGMSYLAARDIRKELRGEGEAALQPWLTYIEQHLTGREEQRAAAASFERTVDDMNLALFPLLRAFADLPMQGVPEFVQDGAVPLYGPMGLRAEVYDMHTMPGSNAIRKFTGYLKQKYHWASKLDHTDKRPIGALIFVAEGGVVDTRVDLVDGAGLRDVKALQDYYFPLKYGFPGTLPDGTTTTPERLTQIVNCVKTELPVLNEFRKAHAK